MLGQTSVKRGWASTASYCPPEEVGGGRSRIVRTPLETDTNQTSRVHTQAEQSEGVGHSRHSGRPERVNARSEAESRSDLCYENEEGAVTSTGEKRLSNPLQKEVVMSDELWRLKERLSKMSTDELIEMVTVGAKDYRQEALDYANAELKYRRVDLSDLKAKEVEQVEEPAVEQAEPVIAPPGSACFVCGGKFRQGTLVAEKELTIVFSDTHEERFVRVNACVQCGQLSMTVDYDTDVAT